MSHLPVYCRRHLAEASAFPPTAIILLLAGLILFHFSPAIAGFSKSERRTFQKHIIDSRKQLHPKYKKVPRRTTRYIIVHTSEAGVNATLRVISKGKHIGGRRITYGGHAHYVIARDGRTFRTLDKKYKADHAGLSMWNGERNVSKISIGIELVGYHYTEITDKQYRSLGILIDILQDIYDLDDRAVLTHSQVAYGRPNRWFKGRHRGRKRCAKNFHRAKAKLGPSWSFDPDVKAGRLTADSELAAIYYGRRLLVAGKADVNIITAENTAWTIAGEDYDSPTTLYKFPNGRILPGDQIDAQTGWNRIPKNTVVLINQEGYPDKTMNQGPVKTISNGLTAWTVAGSKYRDKTTFYIFPTGRIKNGTQITDWDELPSQTRMILGYRGPYNVTSNRPPIKIAGRDYKSKQTLYYFPSKKLLSGDSIRDFRSLPPGVKIFLPARRS